MKIQLNINSIVWRPMRVFFLAASLALSLGSCVVSQQGDDGTADAYQNYVPPLWAPPYDNVSTVRYYYMPDYEMYYDVWDHQFWYPGPGGEWIYTTGMPPAYADVDLSGAFVVLIDRDESRPWERHEYYRDNYPRHGYDQYKDIVVHNRIVTNIAPGHELVPRAFNENNNRVTFMQRPTQPPPSGLGESHPGDVRQPPPPGLGGSRGGQPPPQGEVRQPPPPERPPVPSQQPYHHVVHEVPMRSITPSMPQESRKFNYGSGYNKANAPSKSSAPARSAPPARSSAPSGGGGKK